MVRSSGWLGSVTNLIDRGVSGRQMSLGNAEGTIQERSSHGEPAMLVQHAGHVEQPLEERHFVLAVHMGVDRQCVPEERLRLVIALLVQTRMRQVGQVSGNRRMIRVRVPPSGSPAPARSRARQDRAAPARCEPPRCSGAWWRHWRRPARARARWRQVPAGSNLTASLCSPRCRHSSASWLSRSTVAAN